MENTSVLNLAYDYMHCKYLGVDRCVYSAILYLLVFHLYAAGSVEQNMAAFWADLQAAYVLFGVANRYRYLNKVSMFLRPQTNKLSLRGKAAEIRGLARPLLHIWSGKMTQGLETHRRILLLLKLNWKLEDMLGQFKGSFNMPGPDAAVFGDTMSGFLLLQSELSDFFKDHEPRMFAVTEKSHFLQHLGLEAKWLNPRLIWCFSGEDMQRRVQRLTQTCVKGQGPGQSTVKMCYRYRAALHMQFLKHEADEG